MTEPLYLDDAGRREFEATVERVHGDRIVLNRTAFYPEGGGQPADRGRLVAGDDAWPVADVQKKDTIYHHLDGDAAPLEPGTTVTGRLDWDRRYAHMRYHTAQHVLSAVLLDAYDAATTGNQLYADRARIDVAYPRFDADDLADVAARANEVVAADRDVDHYVLDRGVAEERLDPERTRLDLLPDSVTEVRIVEIDGLDRTACAGTHVDSTGELGRVDVTGRETKGSDEERVRFVLEES